MKKTLTAWQIFGFFFAGIAGVLLHFLFDWTDKSLIVAPFVAVNESIFEHLKLLFFPMFVFAVIESLYIGREYKNFWCIKLIGTVLGMTMVVVLYYTINGIFGGSPDWVNIVIYFVALATGFFVETKLLKDGTKICMHPGAAILILCLIALVFALFTFAPPIIPFFKDPVGGGYGI